MRIIIILLVINKDCGMLISLSWYFLHVRVTKCCHLFFVVKKKKNTYNLPTILEYGQKTLSNNNNNIITFHKRSTFITILY